jgi:fluoroquinolone transport system permease protein
MSPPSAGRLHLPSGTLGTLLRGDARNVGRDPLLLIALALPLATGLSLRWGFPWLADRFADRFDLWPYATFAVGYTLVQCPLLIGVVSGFMLLDERDEGVLAAIAVTPLGPSRFLVYRVTVPALLCVPMIFLAVAVAGLGTPPILPLAIAATLAAVEAPLTTLFLAAFASNKVEGLALAKVAGLAVISPFAALFVAMPWQALAGAIPHYWPVKLFVAGDEDPAAILVYALAGAAVHAIWLIGMLRIFQRRSF